ncbi:MAG: hypothetical protein CL910_12070 [Deltaproteobacteria bacterium]|jgi:nucleoside-diphosphate-sugar epimerase|nr:hypothetical protein [Deltaproteobacteria bacterium]
MVTGGTGFTGSHTVRALRAAGHETRLLVRDPEKVERVFGPGAISPDELVVGDVRDAASVRDALAGCEAVVHAAAMVSLKAAEARQVLETNLEGVENVIGQAAEQGVGRIVHVSSLAIFFSPGCTPLHPEMPIPAGSTAYSESKARAERYVRHLQAEGAPIHVSYPVGIIGPDDPGISGANHALYTWFRDLTIKTSTGFQIVDVRDLAELHRRLVEHEGPPGRFAAAGETVSWYELPDFIESLTGTRLRYLVIPGRLLRALGWVGDQVKRVKDFNFPLTLDTMRFASQWPGTAPCTGSEALGLRIRPIRESYADTLRWMERAGHLSRRQIGRLAE